MKTNIEKTANTMTKITKWILQIIIIPLYKLVKKFFKKNPELLTFPITFVLWYMFGQIAYWFDPTQEPFPLVFIQDILFTTMKVAVYISAGWYIFKLIYGTFTKYLLSDNFKEDFKTLSQWQKILITIIVFFLVFYAFVLVG